MIYDNNNPLKVVTLCSGYDSQCMAFERLKKSHPGFDYELVAWSEIDKYAIQLHNANFPQWADRNLGDMTKIDWSKVPDFDLLTYSTPCTDVSQAGLQKGIQEGSNTRSSILWYTRYAILQKKPKYLMMENVKALVTKKFLPFFNMWKNELESYGYDNFAQVLNASDYGVPQNRERIFLVSIRNDGEENKYRFPKKMPLGKCLADVLESNVDEKYYLSDKMLEYFNRVNEDVTHCHKFKPRGAGDNAFTIRTRPGERVDDNFIDEEKFEDSASDQERLH